eukprot:TRINITY_DN12676_c0_g1_i1.p1 TRINITY_DN12676_c0_g1~~TRINITY_DN12676_c0_g1_i1.p1  ORF type:complete len:157 (+),score=67.09 TRINITY_DN12676_c0_g1_i1:25-471(+)
MMKVTALFLVLIALASAVTYNANVYLTSAQCSGTPQAVSAQEGVCTNYNLGQKASARVTPVSSNVVFFSSWSGDDCQGEPLGVANATLDQCTPFTVVVSGTTFRTSFTISAAPNSTSSDTGGATTTSSASTSALLAGSVAFIAAAMLL